MLTTVALFFPYRYNVDQYNAVFSDPSPLPPQYRIQLAEPVRARRARTFVRPTSSRSASSARSSWAASSRPKSTSGRRTNTSARASKRRPYGRASPPLAGGGAIQGVVAVFSTRRAPSAKSCAHGGLARASGSVRSRVTSARAPKDVEKMLASSARIARRARRRDGAREHPPASRARICRRRSPKPSCSSTRASSARRTESMRSFIGMGYSDCITPPVIQRNILENPGWYTQYTPYQAEISQGRLEALLNFQTMVSDLTGLRDRERVAARRRRPRPPRRCTSRTRSSGSATSRNTFFVSERVPPADDRRREDARATRSASTCVVGDHRQRRLSTRRLRRARPVPGDRRRGRRLRARSSSARTRRARSSSMAADLLALALLDAAGRARRRRRRRQRAALRRAARLRRPARGVSSRRKNEFERKLPGRIIGVSQDAHGKPALRMALQTREQHIRREKATSNICTAQVLLAVIAGMYAVYHGPEGLRAHRDARPRAHGDARARPARSSACTIAHDGVLRHAPRRRGAARACDALRRAARARAGSTCAALDDDCVGDRARRDDDRRATSTTLLAVFGGEQGHAMQCGGRSRRTRRRRSPTALARTSAVPHAPGLQHAPLRDGDAALHRARSRRATCRSRTR